jgi:glycosyltransferase involved in cell wall biosynthesis
MKALFLVFHGFSHHSGITKKIYAQVAALRACDVATTLCHTSFGERGEHLRMVDDAVLKDYGRGLRPKIAKRVEWDSLHDHILREGIGMIYMRSNHNANPFLIRFLGRLRKKGVRTVMEIPTWPYDHEYRGTPVGFRWRLWVDRLFRRAMARHIFRIATFSSDEEIFGRPTVRISNGIDFSSIPLKKRVRNTSKKLTLIGVAEMKRWHGYDRAIAGLGEYYRTGQSVEVFLHLVGGEGDSLDALRAQATAQGVEKYVIFHGPQSGEALDALFEMADMGVASLARHRSGITRIKTLKNREYAARGIPFVYSETDDDFEQMPYVMKAPADESPLDIAAVVRFYGESPRDPAAIRASIEGTLSWKAQMQKVADAVNTTDPPRTTRRKSWPSRAGAG